MKKTSLTLAILFALTIGASAQWGGGLFQYGAVKDEDYYGASIRQNDGGLLSLPTMHGEEQDINAPLGSGIAVLMGLGGAYLVAKRRKEE